MVWNSAQTSSCLLMPNASLIPNPNSPRASEANFIIAAEIQQLSDVGRLGPCRWLPAGMEGFPGAKFGPYAYTDNSK